MKKAASIFLIAILFFNWYGYRIVVDILANKADERLEVTLDNNNYAEGQLIELKIPLNMPYQNDQAGFERHYGKITMNGKLYTYVKRKIEHGYLILKCIPNKINQQISAAGNEYFKAASGLTQPGKQSSNHKNFAKNFWSEYDNKKNDLKYLDFVYPVNLNDVYRNTFYCDCCVSTLTQPPERTIGC